MTSGSPCITAVCFVYVLVSNFSKNVMIFNLMVCDPQADDTLGYVVPNENDE